MDEDIEIINTQTRNEKIKNFFIRNKNKILTIIILSILLLFGYLFYEDQKKKNKIKLSNQYNIIISNFETENRNNFEKDLIKLVNKKDNTYSPLALYFLLDNDIILEKDRINNLFDLVINKVNLEKEIKNLIIYKKGLFNSEFESENNLIKILSPLTNSESIWSSHANYLIGEYFYSKNQKKKAKEFFNKILILKNINPDIMRQVKKRLSRDFSE